MTTKKALGSLLTRWLPEILLAIIIPLFCAGMSELFRAAKSLADNANEEAVTELKAGIWMQSVAFLLLCVVVGRLSLAVRKSSNSLRGPA